MKSRKRITRLNVNAELLPPKGIFEKYHIPEQTLANMRWRRQGPPYVKRGSRILYPKSDFERWRDSQRVEVS